MIRLTIHLLLTLALAACATPQTPGQARNTQAFQAAVKSEPAAFPDREALASFEAEADPVYRLGEGDKLTLTVWGRPELSGKHTVGPDGYITVPLLGPERLSTLTREAAAHQVGQRLRQYYKRPNISISIDEYHANRITVLGRVLTPGALTFDKPPMLLDALARAGSLPVLDKQATLTRCAIFRGREKIIWVDLKRLLNRGELAYNIRLKPNDLIYIPDSFDTLVYVMGAVQKPGAYRLTPDMTVMDALAQAGGPNEDAQPEELMLYRPGKEATERFNWNALMTAERKVNFALEEGDVLFVPKRGIAEAGYIMRQLLPGLSFMTFGLSAVPAGSQR